MNIYIYIYDLELLLINDEYVKIEEHVKFKSISKLILINTHIVIKVLGSIFVKYVLIRLRNLIV